MELMIGIPLLFDICGDGFLAAVFPYRACEIAIRPELASPKLLLNLRTASKDLSCRQAFYRRDYLCHAVPWNRLHEEMNVVLVGADFQEFHLIALLNLYAYLFYRRVHVLIENGTSVLCRKDQMIYKYRNIVAFVYIFAHITTLRRKRRGIQPAEIKQGQGRTPIFIRLPFSTSVPLTARTASAKSR